MLTKRPDCNFCKKVESAMAYIGGYPACGGCILRFDKKQKEKERQAQLELMQEMRDEQNG